MDGQRLGIVIWNIEWRQASEADGIALSARIAACQADIICITEGHIDFLPAAHRIEAAPDGRAPADEHRRKVLLWSRHPWREVDAIGDPELPAGRYIGGLTSTPLGDLWIDGICIPWFGAHVAVGHRDRRPWEEHLTYLNGLGRILRRPHPGCGRLVMGDYNQRIPRRRAPKEAFAALTAAFPEPFSCATSGPLPPEGLTSIDHLHHSAGLRPVSVTVLSNIGANQGQLSDHFGLHVVLERIGP